MDEVRIACPGCGEPVSRIADVGNPWLDAGIVPFSTLHYREDPEYWAKWFPADFITESFPGQFRNWFYAMLAMSTVLRREEPFRTIFGYATLFGEDGRPMHKSWGNAIEFDEAAERMGVDVMRWMYASARPEDNILFGWHAADEARRGLLVLWNVYAFFVTYARLAGWTPATGAPPVRSGRRWTAGSCPAPPGLPRRSRASCGTSTSRRRRGSWTPTSTTSPPGTCACRAGACRAATGADRDAAFATLHEALVALARTVAPILPFLSDSIYRNLVADADPAAPDSVHLTRWPAPELAALRDEALEEAMAVARRAVDLSRTLRGAAGLKARQPLARLWLALPGGDLGEMDALLELVRVEANVKVVELIGDESELVDRGVKVLLPRVGRRLGARIPEVMAAAREGRFEIHADGSVTLAGETLAPDEVEIQATPRPGHRRRRTMTAWWRSSTRRSRRSCAPRAMPASCSARCRTCARRPSWTSTTGSCCGSRAWRRRWTRTSASVAADTLVDEIRRGAPPAGHAGGFRPARGGRGADRRSGALGDEG